MYHEQLITALAAVFAGITAIMAILAVVYNPALLVLALAFGIAAYFMWYQASGRLAARVYRSVEDQGRRNADRGRERGGFGAGPREDWTPPGGRRRRATAGRGAGPGARARQQQRQRRRAPSTTDRPTREEAYRVLGLDPGADNGDVRQAYREKVKEVHPDNGGDEESFRRVNRAYERLTD